MLPSFEQVKSITKCPFTKKAKIIEISSEAGTLYSICQRLTVVLPQLTENKYDGVLVNIPREFTGTLELVGNFLYQILINLDPNCISGIESKEWKLYLFNEKFFVGVIWHGFDIPNPRKCPEGAFLLFQPKESFERGGLKGGEPEIKLRLCIRRIFAKAGKPYDHEPLSEAERFLPGIKWWTYGFLFFYY